MLSKLAHRVRRKRRAAARSFNTDYFRDSEPGSIRFSSEQVAAYGTIKCSVTDPEDGTSLHWDQGSLTECQLDRFVPQCDQLCEKCLQLADNLAQDIDRNEPSTGDLLSYSHHATLGTLRSAAVAGCHLCTLICSGGSLTILNKHTDSTPYSLKIYDYHLRWGNCGIYIATDDEQCLANTRLLGGRPGSKPIPMTMRFPSTGNPTVLDLARTWLEGCTTTHDQCRLPTIPAHPVWSPTRLLQISASDSSISKTPLTRF